MRAVVDVKLGEDPQRVPRAHGQAELVRATRLDFRPVLGISVQKTLWRLSQLCHPFRDGFQALAADGGYFPDGACVADGAE